MVDAQPRNSRTLLKRLQISLLPREYTFSLMNFTVMRILR